MVASRGARAQRERESEEDIPVGAIRPITDGTRRTTGRIRQLVTEADQMLSRIDQVLAPPPDEKPRRHEAHEVLDETTTQQLLGAVTLNKVQAA